MKLMGDKIFVRFTKESLESIFLGKEITREDGSKTRLFLTVDVPDDHDRKATLFIQTAIVEAVSDEVEGVEVGDIAIVNYDLINAPGQLIEHDENGALYWLNATSKYCQKTVIAYANRQSAGDQIVEVRGEIDEVSFLLGLIRGDKLIARQPFIFFDHSDPISDKKTNSGIIYKEYRKILSQRILAVSTLSSKNYGMKEGDKILMYEMDIFEVKLPSGSIDCIYDSDVIAKCL